MFQIGPPLLGRSIQVCQYVVQRTRRQVESLALVAQAHMFMAQHQEGIAHVQSEATFTKMTQEDQQPAQAD